MSNDDLIAVLIRDEDKLREAATIIDPDWTDDYVTVLHDRPKDYSILDFAQEIVTEGIEEHRDELERLVAEKSIYVTSVTVTDPETRLPVELEIRKLTGSGAMVGIDASYLDQDVDTVRNPYNPGTIEIPDDER